LGSGFGLHIYTDYSKGIMTDEEFDEALKRLHKHNKKIESRGRLGEMENDGSGMGMQNVDLDKVTWSHRVVRDWWPREHKTLSHTCSNGIFNINEGLIKVCTNGYLIIDELMKFEEGDYVWNGDFFKYDSSHYADHCSRIIGSNFKLDGVPFFDLGAFPMFYVESEAKKQSSESEEYESGFVDGYNFYKELFGSDEDREISHIEFESVFFKTEHLKYQSWGDLIETSIDTYDLVTKESFKHYDGELIIKTIIP